MCTTIANSGIDVSSHEDTVDWALVELMLLGLTQDQAIAAIAEGKARAEAAMAKLDLADEIDKANAAKTDYMEYLKGNGYGK
jgi:phosphotransferase system HPr-like phosphotransfer protein